MFMPQIVAGWIFSLVLSFGAGYLYKAHRYKVETAALSAAADAAQATTETAVAASDSAQIRNLQRTIDASNARIASLLKQINAAKKEAGNARKNQPAPAECRLPDGVRDEINRGLGAPGAEAAAREVPGRDR